MTTEELARIHAASFTRPRPWNAAEFEGFLADPTCRLIARDQGFILGRCILDEAELLTLAVAPEARRQGLARSLLHSFDAAMRDAGAVTAFLEVAADNIAAQALYAGAGWQNAGRRRDYYGGGVDAQVMRKAL